MYVCVCKGITDKQIQREIEAGVSTLSELQERLEVGMCCGQCRPYATEMIDNNLAMAYAVAV